MIDLVKLQEDWTHKLLSEPALARINIMQLRKMVISSQVDFKLLTKAPRNGRLGCGAVVEMPTFSVPSQPAPGPQGAFELTVLVAEMPTLNTNATTGTLQSAEEVAMTILEIGHRFFVRDTAEFVAAKQAMEPAEFEAGHVAYRVRFAFLHAPTPAARVAVPEIAETAGLVTLTCSTAEADMFYTTDDTFPGSSNPTATRYAGPFQVDSGTVLRVAAYRDGFTGSDVDRATINY